MSHLSNLGFRAETNEQVIDILKSVEPHAQLLPVSKGSYRRFSDPSGSELYIQTNSQNQVIGWNPHFNGTTTRIVKITKQISGSHSELDGTYVAWVGQDLNKNNGYFQAEHPFVFDSPDFLLYENATPPFNAVVQICAFAHEIKDYGNVTSVPFGNGEQKIGGKDLKMARDSFLPSGMFGEEQKEKPQAIANFTGEVIEATLKTNQFSGLQFQWIKAKTLNGPIDIVCDAGIVNPQVDSVVGGFFWLSGRILELLK